MSLYGKDDSNTNVTKAGRGVGSSSQAKQIIFIDNTEAALEENKDRGLNAPGWWSYYTFTDCEGVTRHKAEHLVTIADPEANASETQSDDAVAADATSIIEISVQPANVTTYTPAGSITFYSVTDNGTTLAGEEGETYELTGVDGDIAGTGAAFTVVRASGAGGDVTGVAITAVGSGFVATETITILGSLIGGADGTDDVTLTVDNVGTAAATFSVTAADSPDLGNIVYQWQFQTATGTRWTNVSGATSASLALTGLTIADDGKKYRVKLTSTAGASEVISNVATLTVDDNIFA
jgi:hypothetical protein